eukprot:SAG25_NODE_30_length_20554_cov_36.028694_3_plen_114_part_00
MSFVQVVAGLRDTLSSILNHSFSPHLASTGIHCLVGEVPLAMRNHMFVAATFGERGADEYQEQDETEAHWTNIGRDFFRDWNCCCSPAGALGARAHAAGCIFRAHPGFWLRDQ